MNSCPLPSKKIRERDICVAPRRRRVQHYKAWFSYVGKIPDGLGILLFPDRPRFCRLMKTKNRRYPRSSGMNGDRSGESGAFLFSRRVPDFCDGGRSFPTNENSNLYRRGRRCPSAMDFAHYQSPKLLVFT